VLTAGIRELHLSETALALPALRELRTHLTSVDDFVQRVDERQRPEGYRLVGVFEEGEDAAVAVAGFRTGSSLAWGRYLYVDDLVTKAAFRGRGHGGALMHWLVEEAQRLGCDSLHLDSGTQRHDAHRFYLDHGLHIPGFHFARGVG
jgi:GNAT superfamily N-acetyltransferase